MNVVFDKNVNNPEGFNMGSVINSIHLVSMTTVNVAQLLFAAHPTHPFRTNDSGCIQTIINSYTIFSGTQHFMK